MYDDWPEPRMADPWIIFTGRPHVPDETTDWDAGGHSFLGYFDAYLDNGPISPQLFWESHRFKIWKRPGEQLEPAEIVLPKPVFRHPERTVLQKKLGIGRSRQWLH